MSGFVCLQCALKEFVEILERGDDPMLAGPSTGGYIESGTMEGHARAVHGTPEQCQLERLDLQARAQVGEARLRALHVARSRNAQNN